MKIARRFFAIAALFFALAILSFSGSTQKTASKTHYLALVGTYTNKTASKGIYAFDFDAETGKLTPKGVAAETPDPSWVVIHPNGKFVYAANESGKQSTISAFALDAATGMLTQLNQVSALGEDPCYLSFDKTGKFLFVANYTSGNVVVFPLLVDGKLGGHTANVKDTGTLGPNKERQDAPHAHWVEPTPDNRGVFVADLGLDVVLIYMFNAVDGTLKLSAWNAAPTPGTGPRHAAQGNGLYVLGELSSTVTHFGLGKSTVWPAIQTVSTLPSAYSSRNDSAEISLHPNGKFLYTSNRGEDTIALFSVSQGDGKMNHVTNYPTGGQEPRHFAIDPTGKFLLAENQNSNSIVTFRIDPKNGALTQVSQTTDIPSPVCLMFLAAAH